MIQYGFCDGNDAIKVMIQLYSRKHLSVCEEMHDPITIGFSIADSGLSHGSVRLVTESCHSIAKKSATVFSYFVTSVTFAVSFTFFISHKFILCM